VVVAQYSGVPIIQTLSLMMGTYRRHSKALAAAAGARLEGAQTVYVTKLPIEGVIREEVWGDEIDAHQTK
jgi:hypothetical protein